MSLYAAFFHKYIYDRQVFIEMEIEMCIAVCKAFFRMDPIDTFFMSITLLSVYLKSNYPSK